MKQYLTLFAFVTPFVLFFLIASLIPYEQPADWGDGAVETRSSELADNVDEDSMVVVPERYFAMVATRVVLMGIAIAAFWKIYTKSFPVAIDHWGLIVGIVGAVVWIGVCNLRLESWLLTSFGLDENWLGVRAGVNPFELYPDSSRFNLFILFRFALLVITVPIAEELFLRGFFMRFTDAVAWDELPLNKISTTGLLVGTAYGILSHPSEFIAAALWFSMVTYLMVKTNRFWNCVVAHAVTNLILGIYVMTTGAWHFW